MGGLVVSEPASAVAFDFRPAAFVFHPGLGVIELLQESACCLSGVTTGEMTNA